MYREYCHESGVLHKILVTDDGNNTNNEMMIMIPILVPKMTRKRKPRHFTTILGSDLSTNSKYQTFRVIQYLVFYKNCLERTRPKMDPL